MVPLTVLSPRETSVVGGSVCVPVDAVAGAVDVEDPSTGSPYRSAFNRVSSGDDESSMDGVGGFSVGVGSSFWASQSSFDSSGN